AAEIQRDLVLLNGCCGFDADVGIQLEGIRQVEVTARDAIAAPVEIKLAGEDMDMSKQNGMVPTTATMQVGFGLEFGVRPLHARIGCGRGFHIELQISQESRTGGRPCCALVSAE